MQRNEKKKTENPAPAAARRAFAVPDDELTAAERKLLAMFEAHARAEEKLIAATRRDGERILDRGQAVLGGPTSVMAMIFVKKGFQKLGEHAFVHEHGAELGVTVSEHQHGADLVSDDVPDLADDDEDDGGGARRAGPCYEHKKVSLEAGGRQVANVNFLVPGGPTLAAKHAELRARMAAKMANGGGLIIDIRDELMRVVKIYRWSCDFVLALCDHMRFKLKTRNYNLTSERCRDCGEFHRLERFEALHMSWGLDDGASVAEQHWKQAFATCRAHCGRKPTPDVTEGEAEAARPPTTAD